MRRRQRPARLLGALARRAVVVVLVEGLAVAPSVRSAEAAALADRVVAAEPLAAAPLWLAIGTTALGVGLALGTLLGLVVRSRLARRSRLDAMAEGDELRAANEELQANAAQLEDTVAELEAVQEQLVATNAQLAESEARFRTMADGAPVLLWVAGPDGRCTWFNRQWLEFTGRTMEQEVGDGWSESVHPDDLGACTLAYLTGRGAREPFRADYRLRRADGEYRWMLDTGVPRFAADGAFAGYIGSAIDITDRKRGELAQRRLAAITESSEDAIVGFTLEGVIDSWNRGAERVYGYAAAEVLGRPLSVLAPPDRLDELSSNLERLRRGEDIIPHYDTVRIRKDGRSIHLSLTMSAIHDAAGRIVGGSGSGRDVTERKRAEAAAAAGEARHRLLAEASRLLASSLDLEGTIRAVSSLIVPRLADGYALDLLLEDGALERVAIESRDPAWLDAARHIARSFPRRADDERHPAGRAVRTGRSVLLPELTEAVLESVAADPALREAFRRSGARSYMVVPLLARGRVQGTLSLGLLRPGRRYGEEDLALAEDVAQRAAFAIDNARLFREAQQAIREALAATRARDAFLARASHELRTPLTSAIGTMRLLRRAMEGTLAERPDALVQLANRNLDAMARLVNDLLDVSKLAGGESMASEPIDLHALVGEGVDSVRPLAREQGIEVEQSVPAGVAVSGDRFKLEQVLVNLLGNAIKFTPPGGRIVIEGRTDGGAVVLRVRDTGEGIRADDLERIFEPFVQAARPRGGPRGTGLGLTISRQIAVLHGGGLWAESEGPGKGATFVLRLPAA